MGRSCSIWRMGCPDCTLRTWREDYVSVDDAAEFFGKWYLLRAPLPEKARKEAGHHRQEVDERRLEHR